MPAERPAVVLGLLWAGLSFARSLGRAGVPVTGITMHPHEFGARSRYLRDVRARARRRGGAEGAARAMRRATSKPVLLPGARRPRRARPAPLGRGERAVRAAAARRSRGRAAPAAQGDAAAGGRAGRRRRAAHGRGGARSRRCARSTCGRRSCSSRSRASSSPATFGEKVLVAHDARRRWSPPGSGRRERGFDTVVQELVPGLRRRDLVALRLHRPQRPAAGDASTGVKVRQGPLHFGTSAVFRTTPRAARARARPAPARDAPATRASPTSSSPTTGATATSSCSR